MQLKPIDEIQADLKKSTTDTGKANQLLNLALCYVYRPGEIANDLDSALLLVKQAEGINAHLHNKKIEAKSYFVYSNALREKGNTTLGREYIEKSLALYKTISVPAETGEAWLELSRYYSVYNSKDEIKKKRECLEQALPLYKTVGNKERQGDVLMTLGDLDQILGDQVKAMKELYEALTIYQSIGHKELHGVYDLMGYISSVMGDYPDAVKYGLLAIKTAEEVQDTTLALCTYYNRLALSYENWSKFEQAIIYSKKALTIALKYNDSRAMGFLITNLCLQFSRLHQWEESLKYTRLVEAAMTKPWNAMDSMNVDLSYVITYTETTEYKKAEKYVDQITGLLKTFPIYCLSSKTYPTLVTYYLRTGQYSIAEKYLTSHLSRMIVKADKRTIARDYLLKSQVDSAMGNFTAALTDYQKHKAMTDSMLNEATSFQFAQMEVEHETEKKDNDIKILKQQEEIQKTKLIQSHTTNSIVIASIIVLFLLLTLLYNRYRINQRHNKELETKQQEINGPYRKTSFRKHGMQKYNWQKCSYAACI